MTACAERPAIQLPPRIEKQRLASELVKPCGTSTDGLPDKATPKAVGEFLPVLAGRLDCANDKLEQIGKQVDTIP